jgi:glycosyltransferase involved in cell wall biosynthesis
MKLAWASHGIEHGNAFGYYQANEELARGFVAAGGTIDPAAHLVMQLTYAPLFQRFPAPYSNILMTMYENEETPLSFQKALQRPDLILVPTEWNREVFARHTAVPIRVVPLGVDLDAWPGIIRPRARRRPFRWLWSGAHNPRKGWRHVAAAWKEGRFYLRPDCELYLKSTEVDPVLFEEAHSAVTPRPTVDQMMRVRRVGNVIFDSRRVSHLDLLAIYAEADAFVFPSMGEGWGLTLLEAMATALPCVATVATGQQEFAAGVVRPVDWTLRPTAVRDGRHGPWLEEHVCDASIPDLIRQMEWIMEHPAKAKRLGLAAHRRAQRYGWAAAGQRLLAVLREHFETAAPAASCGG